MNDQIVPFRVEITDAAITDLRERLARARWPDAETVDDWSQGLPLAYAQELAAYWADGYDMRRLERRLNAHPQVRTEIDGVGIHALHVRSPHEEATPLLLTHGWPGSVVEFLDVIGPLTNPTAHGGDPADAFHLVIPSLPGYGFSDRPAEPGWDLPRIAAAWVTLMGRLGYDRFAAQGGDWGSMVTTVLGYAHPEQVLGIHLNMALADPEQLLALGELTDVERVDFADMANYQQREYGYAQQQGTRPQTLGYGLADSPVGQMTWVVEKLRAWSHHGGDVEDVISRDDLLDDVMTYWCTNTGTSSARLYWHSIAWAFSQYVPTVVPIAYSVFPGEILRLSERWARTRYPDLRHYRRVERGGHFAALEQPALFVDEVRAGFRAIRAGTHA